MRVLIPNPSSTLLLLFPWTMPPLRAFTPHRLPFTPHRLPFTPHRLLSTHLPSTTPNTWTTNSVRTQFLTYFTSKNHTFHPSSPCIPPPSDTSLLFTNAGMNQFKPIFLNQIPPNTPLANLKTATNSQKCIRAGGKHNDLEDVGRDTYHHTFFEMLGSWSFGDYFKEEAVDMAWELLTDVYGLEKDRLYATYYEGGDGIEPDIEARDLWLRYLPEERVIACGAADNFWEMGETGPCGPCTEIHYDRIGNRNAAPLVNADDPSVIEIWNIVFIQYNRDEPDKPLALLPQKHIDTGLGLERLVSILQRKDSNYDIDSFQVLIQEIAKYTDAGAYEGKLGKEDVDLKDTAYRAVADHIRTLCFAIADGAIPSNEGRGYVLRRVLRRAARYGQQILKTEKGFLAKLVPVVIDLYSETYPELTSNRNQITSIITDEENSFSSMLERGIKHFAQLESELKSSSHTLINGKEAFFLYDTLGFPLDLTQLMALEAELQVDLEGFEREMEEQKERSREAQRRARVGGGGTVVLRTEDTAWLERQGFDVTEDGEKYNEVELDGSTLLAVFGMEDGAEVPEVGDVVGVVLDRTSFYAEAGGQEADKGVIEVLGDDNDGTKIIGRIDVADVQSYGGYVLHVGTLSEGTLPTSAKVVCKVDYDRRKKITPNHTMTHVLNAALRKVLGDGVEQKGSLCNDEKLRFDFSHDKALTAKQLAKVETFVNDVIDEELEVNGEIMPLEKAKEVDGIVAVFGEVYPDPVRVVSVGDDKSIEFCGGTHVTNTKEAESFVVLEEGAVAKGIRRITAVTRDVAKNAAEEGQKFESNLSTLESESETYPTEQLITLDKTAGSLRKTLESTAMSAPLKTQLRTRIETLQKKSIQAKKAALAQRVDITLELVQTEIDNNPQNHPLTLKLDIGTDSKASQKVMKLCNKANVPFLGISEEEPGSGGKVMAFAVVPENRLEDIRADEWVKATLECVGGKGGGKPGNAQGQAKECEDVDRVLKAAVEYAKEKVGDVKTV